MIRMELGKSFFIISTPFFFTSKESSTSVNPCPTSWQYDLSEDQKEELDKPVQNEEIIRAQASIGSFVILFIKWSLKFL